MRNFSRLLQGFIIFLTGETTGSVTEKQRESNIYFLRRKDIIYCSINVTGNDRDALQTFNKLFSLSFISITFTDLLMWHNENWASALLTSEILIYTECCKCLSEFPLRYCWQSDDIPQYWTINVNDEVL